MGKTPLSEGDVRIFTLADIKFLWLKVRRKIARAAAVGAVLSLCFFLSKPVEYKAEACFKERVEKSGGEGILRNVLSGIHLGDTQPQAIMLMKSNQVLKPLVQQLGLQVSVVKGGFLFKVYRRLRDVIFAERGKSLPDIERFEFADVVYEGESPASFWLSFEDERHFSLLNEKKQPVVRGELGDKIVWGDVSFRLVKNPSFLRLHKPYRTVVSNWIGPVKALRSQIQIRSSKMNSSVYELIFSHRDRHFSARILNGLMLEYQRYLKRDHDQVVSAQLAYLNSKQEGIFLQLSQLLDEHVAYLKKNIGEEGVIGLEGEMAALLNAHQALRSELIGIDVELLRLSQWKEDDFLPSLRRACAFSEPLSRVADKLQTLQGQKDFLELSLKQTGGEAYKEHLAQMQTEELKQIRLRKHFAQTLLDAFDAKQEISFDDSLFDIEKSLALWGNRIRLSEGEEREDFSEYLGNHIRLLSVQERVLQERFFTGDLPPAELGGAPAQTLDSLFLSYANKLDTAESAIRLYAQIQSEMARGDFALSSLSAVLLDPLSQKLIAAAGETSLLLKDETHRTLKEEQRCKNELSLQSQILQDHLQQLYKVEELKAGLYKEKIRGLQKAQVELIHREISVLSQQASEAIAQRRESLLQEELILKRKMGDLCERALQLPEKWKKESWLDVKKEMGTRIMETITELVESKTIGHHLHHVESKPLDLAVVPLFPEKPHLAFKSLLGAILFASALFFLFFVQAIIRGFPSSLEKLQALQFPLLGAISSRCDGPLIGEIPTGSDLELLRQAALFLTKRPQANIVALLVGSGPDFSFALAENLRRMSLKSILIRCDFQSKFSAADCPGLHQLWKKELTELPLRKEKYFDLIPSGGYTPFGAEILQSQEMRDLLAFVKKQYHFVFLLLRSPLDGAEALAALRIAETALVSVNREPTEVLTPFIDWAYHEDEPRLTFLAARQ